MPAGVNSTDGSHRGTSTSLGRRTLPLDWKKVRYFSRISSVFIAADSPRSHGGHGEHGEQRNKPATQKNSRMDHHIGPSSERLGGSAADTITAAKWKSPGPRPLGLNANIRLDLAHSSPPAAAVTTGTMPAARIFSRNSATT